MRRVPGVVFGVLLGGLAAGLALASPAAADTTVETGSVTLSSTSSTQPVALDQFDPATGTLNQVTVTVAVEAATTTEVTNLTRAPKATTVALAVSAAAAGPGSASLGATSTAAGSQDLAPGGSHSFVLSSSGDEDVVITDPAAVAAFVGPGTVTFNVTGEVDVDVRGPAVWRSRGSVDATATVTVEYDFTPEPDEPPTAVDDAATVVEDSGATAVDVLANDTDPDGGPVSIGSVTQPANGTVVITGGGTGLTYQPNPNYCNDPPGTTPDSFTYTLAPGGSTATVSVTVTCVDDPPTAVDDAATVVEDSGATAVDVLANDTDPDGGPVSIGSVTQPANGTVVITGGGTGLTYQPNPNYCNDPPGTTPDSFTYTLAPGGSTATVSVTVTCVVDDPVAVDDAATVVEDSGATAIAVLANDIDPDPVGMTIGSVTQPANGTVVITGGGTGLTYQPDLNYCNDPPGTTPDSFTYSLAPGGSTATVSVTVTCVDDPPTAVDDAATVVEDSGATAVDVLANDTDPDGGPVSIGSVTQPANGTVVITGGGTGLTYQPNPNYCNDPPGTTPDSFTYTLAPGGSTATVSVTVTCVDDPPTAVDDAATVVEDSGATAVDVLANDTDPDGGPVSIGSVTQPANGTVVITGGGTGLTYQPNPNYCNDPPGTTPDSFTYTLAPGGSTATVSVTVTCVVDDPVAVDDAATVVEDSGATAIAVLANDIDPDPVGMTIGSVTQPANGTVVITGGGTGLTYQPDLNYCNDPPGTTPDSFTYSLAPGGSTATVSVTVTCVDDPPTAVDDAATVVEDSGATAVDVLANDTDPDGGPVSIGSVTQPANGTVVITGGGTGLTYQPNPNYCNDPPGTTPDSFTYTLAPGGSTATVSVTVTCVNDAPTAQPHTYTAYANMRVAIPAPGLLQGATDVEAGTTLTVGTLSATTPAGGTITNLNVNTGAFEFDPPPGFTGGNVTFTYTVCDNGTPLPSQCSPAATVTVGVAGPVIWFVDDSATGTETGRLSAPFNTLAEAVTAIGADPNERVFLYDGTYNTGIPLNQGGWLVGQGVTGASFDTVMGITPPAGTITRPPVATGTATVQNTVALATNTRVTGVVLSTAANPALSGSGGLTGVDVTQTSLTTTTGTALSLNNVAGTVALTNVTKNGAGTGIDLTNVNASVTIAAGSISNTTVAAVSLNGGTGAFSYAGTVTNSTGRSVQVQNKTAGTATFSGAIAATGGTGIALTANTGATINFTGDVDLNTATNAAFTATGGGTITATNPDNTLTTTTGTALNVTNTTIGAGRITFRSISANGAPNGAVLNTTGPSGGLTVTGSGSTTPGGDNSGGTIQNTTGHGISLTNTTGPSLRNLRILNTGDSGVNGTQVNGFSFTDSTITGAGDADDENSITFDDSLTSTPNLTGVVTITNNVISQTEAEGIDILNFAGTITNANISNNTLSDTGDVATPGSAVSLLGFGTPTSAGSITRATLANNTITDFRAGAGFQVRAGNVNAGGPPGHAGIAGSATDVIAITGNLMNGGTGGVGNQPDRFVTAGANGIGQGNFNVSNNGTATNRIRNIDCIAIELQADGPVNVTTTVQNNFINPNSAVGCAGIAVAADDPLDMGAGTHTTTISGNNVMGTDGPGIYVIVRDSGSTMTARVLNNTVAAPITTSAARAGIRVDSGSAQGDTTLCLEITGNTTAGSTNLGTLTTSPGINLRKQGTDPAVNTFGIEGLSPSPTGTPNVENHVNAMNTSTPGTFGVGGTALLSAQSGFTSCVAP